MLRALLVAALLAASLSAQISVHPGQDLQAAVNAAPDGGWVLIFGGMYQSPLVIENKSIALVGAAPWTIHDEPGSYPGSVLWPGSPSRTQQAWCIEARGRRDNVLIIHNARLSGRTYASVNLTGGPARIEGFGTVWIADSILTGFDARDLDGREAQPGLIYSTAGGWLLLERSIVIGGIPSSYIWTGQTFSAPHGGAGIAASGSTVQMLIALVRGGEGDRYAFSSGLGAEPSWRPTLAPCPCVGIDAGRGGPAIVSSGILNPELGIIEGGRGAAVTLYIWSNQGLLLVPWGFMPSGAAWMRG